MTSGMLDADYKIIGSLYKLNKMKNEGGSSHNSYGRYYSRDGEWRANGSYDNSDSYGSYDDGYSSRMHYVRGHYSRDEAKNSMIERLETMMNSATSERDKETIRNTINTLKSM